MNKHTIYVTKDMLKQSSSAYEIATRTNRYTEKAVNIIFVLLTMALNWVLLIAGLTRLWGLYLAIGFFGLMLGVDAVRMSQTAFGTNELLSLPIHFNASFMQNDLRIYIVIWLIWRVVSQFFFVIGTSFSFTVVLLLSIPMLTATVLVSISPYERILARNLFPLFALLVLAFPTNDWLPQKESWFFGVLRVALYFSMVFIADFAIPRRILDENKAREAIGLQLATSPKRSSNDDDDTDKEDAQREQFRIQLSSTIAHYQDLCQHDNDRTFAIIALSAWILVTPRIVIGIVGTVILLLQVYLFMTRRHASLRNQQQQQQHQSKTRHVAIDLAAASTIAVPVGDADLKSSTKMVAKRPSVANGTTISPLSAVVMTPTDENDNDDGDGDESMEQSRDDASGSLESQPDQEQQETPRAQPSLSSSARAPTPSPSVLAAARATTTSPPALTGQRVVTRHWT